MTTNDIALPAQPRRIGQATAVEQSRAVAEVHAAILVAQQCPRDVPAAIGQMRQSCQMKALADRAFFRFSRGGAAVSGASVHLARELARCWGNIQYGVAEMSRDDDHGQSEMLAYAWDVQTNARASTVFIVPHKRDKRSGPERLVDMRDIYENNANAGARRVRECIFGVLPPWFVEEAKDLCTKTITDGGGKPLAQRVADALAMFADIGVTQDDITRKLGRPAGKWTAHDVAQLGVVYTSIQRGEVSRDDEFPPDVVTAEEITASAPPAGDPTGGKEPPAGRAKPKGMQVGVWHDAGHTNPGGGARRNAWDPDCSVCRDDPAGGEHYYGHTAQRDDGCSFCQRETAWDAADQDGQ